MTDAERIARLAEWMGWKWDAKRMWFVAPNGDCWLDGQWNPERIEHAMMLEDEVERRGVYIKGRYVEALNSQFQYSSKLEERWLFTHATAAQRSAAVEKLMEGKHERQ